MPEFSCFDSIRSKIRQKSVDEPVYLHECVFGREILYMYISVIIYSSIELQLQSLLPSTLRIVRQT